MGYAAELEAIYAKWERRVVERGIQEGRQQGMELGMELGLKMGREEGLRTALVSVYQARFGTLPAALREAIVVTMDVPTLQRWTALFGTATADEIAAALRQPARE
jgi:flagellar biosynthesis/type III secretory pathway protein FliH